MNPRERRLLGLLVLIILGAVVLEVARPEPVDWTPSFDHDDTRPYGSRVLAELLPDLIPAADVTLVRLPPYLALRDTTRRGTSYVFITDVFEPDPIEADRLLAFAGRGNTVFVAAGWIAGALADSLHLDIQTVSQGWNGPPLGGERDTAGVNFVSPSLRADSAFHFAPDVATTAFRGVDTVRTTVLGVAEAGRPAYIRVDHGTGAFYLTTLPLAFTNYAILDAGTTDFVPRALSYLPDQPVLWDAYHKPLRNTATTPLRYILQAPALRNAYVVVLVLVLLIIVFEGRRRQRVVPVVEPLRNTTVEFVRTVGRLYLHQGDHAGLAAKKAAHFLDFVRTRLGLPADPGEAARIAERAGVHEAVVRSAFEAVAFVHGRARLTEAELRRVNAAMETFYRRSTR